MSKKILLRAAHRAAIVLGLVLVVAGSTALYADDPFVRIIDRCEPVSFNQAIGPGTCIGNGDVTFSEFIAELRENRSVDDWVFDPSDLDLENIGQRLVPQNIGGETHTFTRVTEFGGGFVPELNQLSGNLIPRPECARVLPGGRLAPQPPSPTNVFVQAGRAAQGPAVTSGATKFQCCIHPWMRTTVNTDHH